MNMSTFSRKLPVWQQARQALLSILSTILGAQVAMAAPSVFNEITFQKAPDRTAVKTDEVYKLAALLNRPCVVQDAAAWNSVNPAGDLKTFPPDAMRDLKNFKEVSERLDWPGRSAGAFQRLYLGKSTQRGDEFTFLWIAGKNDVSLHICGGQPERSKKHPDFDKCAMGASGPPAPLGVCPKLSDM
ncbi:MAG: hypothetical protein V7631_3345 [Massilia sp.]|jgi:hypothetical protein